MRITEGQYSLAKGVTYYTPDKIYEYTYDEKKLVVSGLFRLQNGLRHGAITEKIGGVIIAVEISSPCEDVIRIRATHHQHQVTSEGKFPLNYEQFHPIHVEETAASILVTIGKLSLKLRKDPWSLDFLGESGKICTTSPQQGLGLAEVNPGQQFMGEKLSLAPDEYIYGLGERFSPFIRNGQHVKIWNGDYATTSDMGYKNIPFYLSNKGYGVFVNSSDKVEYEIATEEVEAVRFTVLGNELDYYFIYGPTPKEVLSKYTALTGRPPLIPKWSLGLWLTTSFTTVYNEQIVTEHIDGMAERDIPLTVFHFDCYWMKERHWCDFQWDTDAFPHPAEMLKRLKARGLKICVWINPYISELSSLFQEGREQGYFLTRQNGEVYQIDWWQPGLAFVDFTNPAACTWYQDKLKALIEMGVDTFKTDFAESAPEDAVYYNGHDGKPMHNLYTLLYNQTVFDLLEQTLGKDQALVFARSATACSQRYPVHWGGDCSATLTSMATELRGGLSFACSGVAFWSHDIGGFYGKQDPDVYKRWVAFGLFSSHSRLHGDSTYRVPWNYDEEAVEVLRHFTRVRHQLIPYLYSCCKTAHDHGTPVLRPMLLEFPEDPTCLFLDKQYMLGDSLLVAPVFNAEGIVQYYLPEGEWTNFWTNERRQGGKWFKEQFGYMQLPLWVRENAIIPMGPVEQAPFRSSFDDLTVHVYNLKTSAQFDLYDAGKTVHIAAERWDKSIVVRVSEPIVGLKVEVKGLKAVAKVEGASTYQVKDDGVVVEVADQEVRMIGST
jgi:alpha-D-xyloside xylohydrolase